MKNITITEQTVQTMMGKIKHRGPDDEGLFLDHNIGLGFVRLSILDLSLFGHQPMFDDSRRYVIIHNGEVYNFIEIRDELLSKGYLFRSNTDTEVILKAYLEWGEDCLHRFNGMWAFCIYDTYTKELFCARDRYGVKPFYFYKDEEKFIFASEIPAILSALEEKPEPNFQAIFDYLVFNRTDQNQNTFFSEINKLLHGHCIKINQKSFKLKKWYDLRSSVAKTVGFKDEGEYKNLFSSAVALRLRSDVPIGVCLSGGLDSSSIVSILLKEFEKPDVNTFSAIYNKDEKGDESDFINLFKGEVENMYFIKPDLSSLLENLTHFVVAHAEPIPSTSPFAQFNVMKLAKQHVVVTLDGQGADECLAGYHYFYGLYFKDLLLSLRVIKLLKEIFKYLSLHKSAHGLTTFFFFLLPPFLRTKLRVAKNSYVISSFVSRYSKTSQISDDLYGANSLRDSLLNHFEFKLEHLLKWADRNSMFFSLESRAPFLDYRLVEKTLATSSDKLINHGWTKSILRKALKGILPEPIRSRKDKIGFETPQSKWFRTKEFEEYYSSIMSSLQLEKFGIVSREGAMKLLKVHTSTTQDLSKEIWKVLNLELWFREFIKS